MRAAERGPGARLLAGLVREEGLLPLTGHAYEDRGAPFIVVSEILEDIIRVLPRKALRNALGNTAPSIGPARSVRCHWPGQTRRSRTELLK